MGENRYAIKNVLIVVNDIERSKNFTKISSGLRLSWTTRKCDPDRRLVLQDATIWAEFIENLVIPHNNASELYFEENNIEEFAQKLDESPYDIEYVNRLMTHSWGQKVIRFYDPDGNLIEVGTP